MNEIKTIELSEGDKVEIKKKYFTWMSQVSDFPAEKVSAMEEESYTKMSREVRTWIARQLYFFTDLSVGEIGNIDENFSEKDIAYLIDSTIKFNSVEMEVESREEFFEEENEEFISEGTLNRL